MLESYYGAQEYSWYFPFDRFGSINLTNSSPVQTFTEPFALGELCRFLRIATPTDPDRANELQGFISAARAQAEILQNRDLVIKQYDMNFDYWMNWRVRLRAPLQSVDLVQYTDSDDEVHTMNQPADYRVDSSKQPGEVYQPYNVVFPTFTPRPSSAVLIRFTSGYSSLDPFWSDAGAIIKVGMKQLISGWDNNRIPFEIGSGSAAEYPYTVTSCLSYGALIRVR